MDEPFPCRSCDQLPKLGYSLLQGRTYNRFSCMKCQAESFPRETIEEARVDWNQRHGKPISDEPDQ